MLQSVTGNFVKVILLQFVTFCNIEFVTFVTFQHGVNEEVRCCYKCYRKSSVKIFENDFNCALS